MIKKVLNILESIKILRSFRVRIFLVLLIVGIVPSLVIHAAVLSSYEDRAVSVRESEVQNQLRTIANYIIIHDYLNNPSSNFIEAEMEQFVSLYEGRVVVINDSYEVITDTQDISVGEIVDSDDIIRCFDGISSASYDRKESCIEMLVPIMETVKEQVDEEEDGIVIGVLYAHVSTDTITMTMTILSRTAWIINIVVLIFIFLLATIFSRVLTEPFNKVTDAINDVSAGFTDQALSVPDYKETEHIVEAFNRVLSRMRTLDESRKEFVANVSHELKTPITSIKLLADSLVAQDEVPAELYREFMNDIVGEIDREDKIINDLLELVKLDKTNGSLTIEEVNVNNLIELTLKRLKPIAEHENVSLIFDSNKEVVAEIDDVKMTLAITNFIENAIKYNRDDGKVIVTLEEDHQKFIVRVEDTGIGIPEESVDRIFERFYRVDKSHSREIGGTGLGLAIARNIILMHRGTIDIASEPGVGTTFTITVPIAYNVK